ncbi:MAG: pilin [Microgenomates group bacterium]
MRRFILFFLLIFLFFIPFTSFSFGEERFATCDLCGYCPPNPPPSSWQKCAECLYPEVSDPESKQTLRIDPETNIPPTPYPGRQYTMLGCLKTDLGSFQQEGAAVGVIQALLQIVFSVVGGIAFLSLIYGAFVLATSQNNPEKINYGKRIIYGAIIGLIFSLSSVFIINLLASRVLKIPGFSE